MAQMKFVTPRMEFKVRKKRRYTEAGKFVVKIKEIQEEAKVTLEKTQKKIKKYIDRKKVEVDEYKIEDLVMLSTKDLKYQIVDKRTKKLMKRFVGSYKVKKIILANAIELELSSIIRIHLVVNINRIHKYIGQVKEQRKEQLAPVITEGEEKWKIKRILNK